jgi:hypothetical protein
MHSTQGLASPSKNLRVKVLNSRALLHAPEFQIWFSKEIHAAHAIERVHDLVLVQM